MKELSPENWLERDPTPDAFPRLGGGDPLEPAAVGAIILGIRLSDRVPDEVRADFEAGRAAVVYGVFFYGLYDVGIAHLGRVALRALEDVRAALGEDPRDRLPAESRSWWSAVGAMATGRFASDRQLVADEIEDVVRRLAHSINVLFDPDVDFLAAWSRRRG